MTDRDPIGMVPRSHNLWSAFSRRHNRVLAGVVLFGLMGTLVFAGPGWLADWFNRRGYHSLSMRQLEAARSQFLWGRHFDASQGESLMGLARIERLSGQPARMQNYLTEAEQRGVPAERIRRELLLSEIQSGRIRGLLREVPSLLINAGEDAPAVSEALASGYFQAYRINDAMALLGAWQRDYPDDPQPFVVRGTYYLQRQSWNQAAAEFEQALKLGPQRNDARLLWADSLYNLQQLEAARRQYEQCLKASPSDPIAMIGLGRCLFETGELSQARDVFERALKAMPDSWEGRFYMGKLLAADDRPAEAVKYLEAVCQERPYMPNARYTLALALKAAKQADQAEPHFQFVMEQQQAQAGIRNKLEQLERDPRRTDLRLEIGQTLLKYGNPAEGRGWLQSVLEIEPQNQDALAALAESRRGDDLRDGQTGHNPP